MLGSEKEELQDSEQVDSASFCVKREWIQFIVSLFGFKGYTKKINECGELWVWVPFFQIMTVIVINSKHYLEITPYQYMRYSSQLHSISLMLYKIAEWALY